MTNEFHYRKRLDSLLEGIQIIDYQWKYVYLNDVMTQQARTTKENLFGHTMMEKYPGIEQTEMFQLLQATMNDRRSRRMENQFTFPDGVVQWFDLRIEPADEGICILSLDITKHKEYEQKIEKAKNLYAFLSHINQSIVHIKTERELFSIACEIAIRYGGFTMAWIGLFSPDYSNITLVEHCGMPDNVMPEFAEKLFLDHGPIPQMLENQTHFLCNNTLESGNSNLQSYAAHYGILSFVILPLRKDGRIIGALHLHADQPEFLGVDEMALLEEITSDISFALDNYERERRHRETERLVVENENRFRALIEKSTDMKTLADREGRLFYGSPSVAETLGYRSEDRMGALVFDFIHPDDLPEFLSNREQLLRHPGETMAFEMRMRHADGHWIWTEGTVSNMLDEKGIHGLVSNFRDITQRKHDQQQLEFERKNTEALIDNTQDMMWSVDNQLRLITANRSFHEQIAKGLGRNMQVGEYIFEYKLPEEKKAQYENYYSRALSGESFVEMVHVTQPRLNWAEIAFRPIVKDNIVVGVACHAHEITKRMLAERRLEQQNRDLTKANFELDRFVYSVSHDLRSPLTSILGLLSVMESETQETSTMMHLDMIRGRIHRLDDFIRNILHYSRTNRTDLEIEKIVLQDVATQAIDSLRGIKEMQNVRFDLLVPSDIVLYSDRQSVLTIFENLLTNAIKFQDKNRPETIISVTAQRDQDKIELEISDNGVGVEAQHIDRIFEMFFRASAKTEGAGLGLYIVNEIVAKLGGSISVRSQPNQGTTFYVSLKNHPL